jgi:hypothetical protein
MPSRQRDCEPFRSERQAGCGKASLSTSSQLRLALSRAFAATHFWIGSVGMIAQRRDIGGQDGHGSGLAASPANDADATSTPREVAAPQAHRILANAERFCNVRARPTQQRQQYGSRPISLAAIARDRQPPQSRLLFLPRHHQRFAPCPTPANQRENGMTASIVG